MLSWKLAGRELSLLLFIYWRDIELTWSILFLFDCVCVCVVFARLTVPA